MLFWIWSICIVTALVLYFRQAYSRFSRHGVKHFTPIPPLGNMWRILARKEHVSNNIERSYRTFQGQRFIGRYEFLSAMIMIRDIDLIKKITVKDFDHFIDHRIPIDDLIDPLVRNLVILKGQEWKDMRSTLSPAFTSSKIRLMVPFMVEAGDQMIQFLNNKTKESDRGHVDLDTKDLTARYANDVIATCAFGLKVDSHEDRNNVFYDMGNAATNSSSKLFLKFLFFIIAPRIAKKLKLSLFPKNINDYFKNLVLNTMRDRESRHIIRPDMIHLLMEAQKGKLSHDKTNEDADAGFATVEEFAINKKNVKRVWSDDDVVAQAMLFFLAGFDTVSTAMTFLLYELAVNTDVQDKLYQEIRENDLRNGGQFDYNSVQQMTYLDMVVSEVLRLWPPAVVMDRVCVKDYNLGKPDDCATEDYIIRKGEGLHIPMWAIHRDPEFYPDPLKFDPERFSEENKHKINPFAYMPFGLGPRNCIASRFALCEVKVMTYQLLQHMEVSPSKKTRIPAQLCKKEMNLRMEGGHHLRFSVRK